MATTPFSLSHWSSGMFERKEEAICDISLMTKASGQARWLSESSSGTP